MLATERHGRIKSSLATLCHLEDSSTAENNSYFNAAHGLSQIPNMPDKQVAAGKTELFVRNMHGSFQTLLQQKDPVALLLLYLWYRKVGRRLWWVGARARVECPAIYSYLRLCHKDDDVHAFLPGGSLADEFQ